MKILLFANTDWYLYNFRRTLAFALQDAGHEVLLMSPSGPFGEKLKAFGLRWIPVPMSRRSLNPFREIFLVFWLRRFLLVECVDLVHGFTIKGAVYGSFAGWLAGVSARVNGIDGLGYVFASNNLKARLLRPLVKVLLQLALFGKNSRLILLNRDDVELFKQFPFIDSDLIRMIPGAGVDCKRFSLAGQRVIHQPLRVLMAARLLWDKGLGEYVAAARILKARGKNIEFLLAGTPDPGNPRSVDECAVHGWMNEGLINWLGHVSDMPALLATVHVVVLPSYREGLPTTLTEAAACSLPLITTNAPGCRDVVTDEVDGLLVPVCDADALAFAITRLDDDPGLAARLGAAARVKALTLFEEKIVIASTMAVYAELFS